MTLGCAASGRGYAYGGVRLRVRQDPRGPSAHRLNSGSIYADHAPRGDEL
jgi:hypothetical protein